MDTVRAAFMQEVRKYRWRRYVRHGFTAIAIFLVVVVFYNRSAGWRDTLGGRVISCQFVRSDGKLYMAVFWARNGKIAVEWRPWPEDVP